MTRPTNTRAGIRQAICLELNMPFFKRFPTGASLSTGCTTTVLVDTDLGQAADYWNNGWALLTSSGAGEYGEFRQISDFASGGSMTLEYALSGAPSSGEDYEIVSVFSPAEIHQAINRSLESAFPSFFSQYADESIVIQEDTLEYSLTGITNRPWTLSKVWIENNDTVIRGEVDSVTNTTLVDASADFTDIDTDCKVSIYKGTGKGQLRDVLSVSGTTLIVDTWTTNPDTTSHYAVWNPTDQENDWVRNIAVRVDVKDYPSKVSLIQNFPAFEGMRMRLEYFSKPAALTADNSTTEVPLEYLVDRTIAILAQSKLNDNRVSRQRWTQIADEYTKRSEQYRILNGWSLPEQTNWMTDRPGVSHHGDDLGNPLEW